MNKPDLFRFKAKQVIKTRAMKFETPMGLGKKVVPPALLVNLMC